MWRIRPARAVRLALLIALSGAVPSSVRADDLAPAVTSELRLERMLPTSPFALPVAATFLPDGRLLIAQKTGEILLWEGGSATPRLLGTIPTASAQNERGLLGLAVDPLFPSTRRLYVYFSSGDTQSAGYVTLASDDTFVGASVLVLLTGMSTDGGHVGGALAFGPDGFLYIGVGDTGCNCNCAPSDTPTNYFSTCLSNLHGKILRIDRDGNIPNTNPLVGISAATACASGSACDAAGTPPGSTGAPRPEIYNWGFRNPWRFVFDEERGHLWVADVGELTREEITISTGPGQHHGWPWREGDLGDPVEQCATSTPPSGNCIEPALVYGHDEDPETGDASVSGGVFANHCSWPAPYRGTYVFGDFEKRIIWRVTPNADRDGVDGDRTVLVTNAAGPVHFARGPDGGIYYLNVEDGSLWRLTPAQPATCPEPDAGPPDADPPDAGPPDVGPEDAGPPRDAGSPEAGSTPGDDGGSGQPDGGSDADGSRPGTERTAEDPDGASCRCEDPRGSPPGTGVALTLWAGAILLFRRRIR